MNSEDLKLIKYAAKEAGFNVASITNPDGLKFTNGDFSFKKTGNSAGEFAVELDKFAYNYKQKNGASLNPWKMEICGKLEKLANELTNVVPAADRDSYREKKEQEIKERAEAKRQREAEWRAQQREKKQQEQKGQQGQQRQQEQGYKKRNIYDTEQVRFAEGLRDKEQSTRIYSKNEYKLFVTEQPQKNGIMKDVWYVKNGEGNVILGLAGSKEAVLKQLNSVTQSKINGIPQDLQEFAKGATKAIKKDTSRINIATKINDDLSCLSKGGTVKHGFGRALDGVAQGLMQSAAPDPGTKMAMLACYNIFKALAKMATAALAISLLEADRGRVGLSEMLKDIGTSAAKKAQKLFNSKKMEPVKNGFAKKAWDVKFYATGKNVNTAQIQKIAEMLEQDSIKIDALNAKKDKLLLDIRDGEMGNSALLKELLPGNREELKKIELEIANIEAKDKHLTRFLADALDGKATSELQLYASTLDLQVGIEEHNKINGVKKMQFPENAALTRRVAVAGEQEKNIAEKWAIDYCKKTGNSYADAYNLYNKNNPLTNQERKDLLDMFNKNIPETVRKMAQERVIQGQLDAVLKLKNNAR